MDCAACGDCCDPVWLLLEPHEYRDLMARLAAGGRHLSAESRENAEWFRDHFTVDLDNAFAPPPGSEGLLPFACDAFDPESRLCTAHDTRPPICRQYPWDGAPPSLDVVWLPEGCSHWWDLPAAERGPVERRLLPLWPVTT